MSLLFINWDKIIDMQKNNKKAKRSVSLVIILVLFFVQIAPVKVMAATFEVPDTLINAYTTGTSTANPINSSDNDPSGISNKQQGPKVDVSFTAQGPINKGVRVSATATPSYFNNSSDPTKLYFTWYLKKAGCDLTDSDHPSGTKIKDNETVMIDADSDTGKIASCDRDNDRIITVNDWKIEAARIIVSSGFDYENADYSKDIDNKLSAFSAVPEISENHWRKGFLRNGNGDIYEDNKDEAENCYVQSPDSGSMYELRNVTSDLDDSSDGCPVGFHRSCVSQQTVECQIFNTAYSCADAAAAANAIPPIQYDVPQGIFDTNIPSTGLFTACAISSQKEGKPTPDDFCKVTDAANFKSAVACNDDGNKKSYAICMEDKNTVFNDKDLEPIGVIVNTKPEKGNENINKDNICQSVARQYTTNDPTCVIQNNIFFPNNDVDNPPLFTSAQEDCNAITDGLINGTKDAFGNTVIEGNDKLAPQCTFKKAENLCKHLFPVLPKNDAVNGIGIDLNNSVVGDGKFSIEEKAFWHADPTKAATIEGGKDEQKLVGLGVDKFNWTYNTGDQVGVVVEGDSIFGTQHLDSKFKRMWAFSKNTCKALDDIEKNEGFYFEGTGQIRPGFLTTSVDLNDCLEENLLEPDDGGLYSLKIELGANPENPINDPEGDGDILSINSASLNSNDQNGLLYQWSVQKSKDGSTPPADDTSWLDITNKLIQEESFSEIDRQGLGKSKLDIKLNIKDIENSMSPGSFTGVFYLKIKLKVKSNNADGGQNAEGFITVRVKQQENRIAVYPVNADNSGMLSLNKGLSGSSTELCLQDDTMRCNVTKNQLIGLELVSPDKNKLSNVSWKVNGTITNCLKSISSSCEVGGNKLFIPILGNEGEAIDVVATATNEKNESIDINKHFVIGASQVQILSADISSSCSMQCLDNSSACPKYLGHYNYLNGATLPDCSNDVWETREGNTVTLQTYGQTGFDWAIDGQIRPEFQDKNQIQFTVDKFAGESYNIGLSTRILSGTVAQKNNLRKALYKNWGVSPEEAIEENQSANIQLNVMEGNGQVIASKKNTNLAASLITHLPQQLMFLFKIFLTSATLLISMSLLFALMPEAAFRENE